MNYCPSLDVRVRFRVCVLLLCGCGFWWCKCYWTTAVDGILCVVAAVFVAVVAAAADDDDFDVDENGS